MAGFVLIAGATEALMFFSRKVKGSIAFFIGLILIISNFKTFGVVFQLYGAFEFFKAFGGILVRWLAVFPVIGPVVGYTLIRTFIRKLRCLPKER